MKTGLVLLLGILLTACSPNLGDAPFLCNKGGKPECPSGYRCKGTRCIPVGQCPSSVPGCPGYQVCGDGTCGPGEDRQNCPRDCKTGDSGPLLDRGLHDKRPPDLVPQPDRPLPGQPFGGVCNAAQSCRVGLRCFEIGITGTGFCTQQCTVVDQPCSGTPGNTRAYCVIEDAGKFFCGFVCKWSGITYTCPPALKCNSVENPPGSGRNFCMP